MTHPVPAPPELPAGLAVVPVTIWREARGEREEGMRAVGWVIDNRCADVHHRWPKQPDQVCLAHAHFACWLESDPQWNLYPRPSDPLYRVAQAVWSAIQDGSDADDPTNSATYYCNPDVLVHNPFAKPAYVETARIGHYTFYRNA